MKRGGPKVVRVIGPLVVAGCVVGCGGLVPDPATRTSDDGGAPALAAPDAEGGARDRDARAPDDAAADSGPTPRDAAPTPTDAAPNACGDGVLTAGEACDDGNAASADGCSATCQIEPGWSCSGAPSVCATICGDGIVAGNETCDDERSCPGTCRRTSWSRRYGDEWYKTVSGVAVDTTGASILTGFYARTLDFGGGPLSATGTSDIFVAKIDPAGNHVWSRRFGGTGDDRALAVATDAAGNVVITGVFLSTIDFGGGPLVALGSWDVFVVKLDAAGNHLWSKRYGDSAQQEGHSVAIDAGGNIVFGGMFWGTLDFGGGVMTAGSIDGFVAKLDASGNHVWSKRVASTGGQNTRGVAVSGSGAVFVTGTCKGSADFGGGPLAAIGDEDAFLLALDASGQHQWSKRWGAGNAYQGGTSVTVDSAGDVVVAGNSHGPANLGTGVLADNGMIDVVVGKFSPGGSPLFARRFGSPRNDVPTSVATDASNNVLLTGYYDGPIDFGHGPLAHTGLSNTFITKLDPSGALLWSKGYGASATGKGIAADALGNVLVTGDFSNGIHFGGGAPLAGAGLFLAKLTP